MEIYRFRSIHALLDGFHELENQEIYFAPPEKLNDPVEGFKDIFWNGDMIVWENLLKHYLRCLLHVTYISTITGESKKLTKEDIPVEGHIFLNPPNALRKLYDSAYLSFFQQKAIKGLIKGLSNRKGVIRRSELIAHFKIIHLYAIESISIILVEEGFITKPIISTRNSILMDGILSKYGSLAHLTNLMEKDGKSDAINVLFDVVSNQMFQSELITKLNFPDPNSHSNRFFIITEFIEHFVNRLEDILFPDWYSASFLSDYTNSAVWGHYGDSHKGVCLKFKVQGEEKKEFLNLKFPLKDENAFEEIKLFFKQIEYNKKAPEIDFFRSIGRMPVYQLKQLWYSNSNGNLSTCAEHLEKDKELWHQSYWKNFYECISTKSAEWSYEEEYRLILDGHNKNFHDIAETKLKYDFVCLEGIIFGIKTSSSDKIRIIKIIHDKCRREDRKSFDFFQAKYSRVSGKIEIEKLNVISDLKNI